MRKLLLAFAFMVVYSLNANAQQEVRYTKFIFNKLAFNPAYAGSVEGFDLTALFRRQWVNIPGSPTSATLSGHTGLGINKKVGVGAFIEYDKIGVHNSLDFQMTYSYRFLLGESRLAVGLQGGIFNMRSDWGAVTGDDLVDGTDPAFNNLPSSELLPNFGVGLYYYKPNSFYVGASVPRLLENELESVSRLAHQYRHYYAMAGVVFGGDKFKVKPSTLVKMVPSNAPVQVDANLMFLIRDVFWIGGTYRAAVGNTYTLADGTNGSFIQSESVDFIAAFLMKKGLRIGYAYDLTLSPLGMYTSGSHEVMLGYSFVGKGPRIRTPRYF